MVSATTGCAKTPLQWPCPPDSTDDRNPIRYLTTVSARLSSSAKTAAYPRLAFPTASGRAVFFARPHLLPEEMPDDDYPFLLNTGRLAHQWHTMTKTGKVAKLNKLNPGPFVEIHPDDAARLQISDGDPVEIASRRGRAVLPAVVTDRVRPGNCFAPFHWNDAFGEYLSINAVTNDAVDPISRQPEYKACAVTLTKVAVARPDSARRARCAEHRPRRTSEAGNRRSQVDALAEILGLAHEPTPQFGPLGRSYLAGLIAGLRSEAGRRMAGVPTLPLSAPFDSGTRLWVDGLLAGIVRAHRGAPVNAASPSAQGRRATRARAAPERAPIVVLWASQTGNAEELAADCRRATQRGRAAGRVARHGRLPGRRAADNTGAAADHQHHRGRRAAGQRRRPVAGAIR